MCLHFWSPYVFASNYLHVVKFLQVPLHMTISVYSSMGQKHHLPLCPFSGGQGIVEQLGLTGDMFHGVIGGLRLGKVPGYETLCHL